MQGPWEAACAIPVTGFRKVLTHSTAQRLAHSGRMGGGERRMEPRDLMVQEALVYLVFLTFYTFSKEGPQMESPPHSPVPWAELSPNLSALRMGLYSETRPLKMYLHSSEVLAAGPAPV